MSLRLLAPSAIALALIFQPIPALAGETGPAGELPAGNAFRSRMMDWSAHPPEPEEDRQAPSMKRVPAPHTLPRLSSHYGYRTDPIEGGRRLHGGIDIPGPIGSAVYAAAAGRVSFAGWRGGYGEMVEIDHGNGLATRYAHLSHSLVRPGMRVEQGERIALMGATGRATGSHLHFEVRSDGRALDPLGFLTGGYRQILPDAAPLKPLERHISPFARAKAAETAEVSP